MYEDDFETTRFPEPPMLTKNQGREETSVRQHPILEDDYNRYIRYVESLIRYTFTDRRLLAQALRHRSACGPIEGTLASNERLEFLGDRVLGLVTAHLLYNRFPNEEEGMLAVRLSNTVRTEMLAQLSEKISLNPVLIRDFSGCCQSVSTAMSADAFEALIGAVYLDSDFHEAFRVLEDLITPLLAGALPAEKDPKTRLQEWTHKRKLPLPVYETLSQNGPDHCPVFEVYVAIESHGQFHGMGSCKKAAQQKAATAALAALPSDEDS